MPEPALADLVITAPDQEAERQCRRWLCAVDGQFGRMADVVAWVASVRGITVPGPFEAPRLVLVGHSHEAPTNGTGLDQNSVTPRLIAQTRTGAGLYARLADAAGVALTVLDLSYQPGFLAEPESVDGISSMAAAFTAGRSTADRVVDSGADLLIPALTAAGVNTAAAVLVAAITDEEPAAMTGRGNGLNDAAWMVECVRVRDRLRQARPHREVPMALLAAAGSAELATVAGLLVQAAVRRTPVLLDGLGLIAAALLTREIAPSATAWWWAAHLGEDPAERTACDSLGLTPIMRSGLRAGDGTAALTVLPFLRSLLLAGAELEAEPKTGTEAETGVPTSAKAGIVAEAAATPTGIEVAAGIETGPGIEVSRRGNLA
jgi:nicotinate-nucleotide--dimethylbenzimidazole phosphoribosyltransferase